MTEDSTWGSELRTEEQLEHDSSLSSSEDDDVEHDSDEHVEPDVAEEAEDTEQWSPSAWESITAISYTFY